MNIVIKISIHVLREEDDAKRSAQAETVRHFYPRPPRGGRLVSDFFILLSVHISIHVLREEDDEWTTDILTQAVAFLSTSSARRTTGKAARQGRRNYISIHVLREEDDFLFLCKRK